MGTRHDYMLNNTIFRNGSFLVFKSNHSSNSLSFGDTRVTHKRMDRQHITLLLSQY